MTYSSKVFRPDYAPHPGELIEETIQVLGISARELARRCGRSAKLITEIILGKAALEPETALQLERVLDIDANIWLNLEASYRLHLARLEDDATLAESVKWVSSFPVRELCKRGELTSSGADSKAVSELLRFFGVASVDACTEYCNSMGVSYRHSSSFSTDRNALFVWLRLGEMQAERIQCAEFDRSKLIAALHEIRTFTTISNINEFMPRIVKALADVGVAFVIVRPFAKMALSGVSRWLSPRKALIQQTVRHMSDDHFWFTLFHEAAHILLHSRKVVFVDGKDASGSQQEENEANHWAADFLIPRAEFAKFVSVGVFTESAVRSFARDQQIAPGIVVGQLQKAGVVAYSQLNRLKLRFEWRT